MAYEIDLPDGSRGLIHDNVPRSKSLEAAQRAYPDAFPPPPTALGQALNAPKNIFKGVGSGLVQAVGGLSSLPYAGARYFNPEMTPFAETGFGKSITSAEQSLAPTDEGLGSQFSHGLGSFISMLGPQAGLRGLGTAIKGVAPRAAAPVAVAQTAGLGAEEARQRVETARADGQTVTPGQEFGSLVAGVPAGLTELLPIQNLFRATKGLNKPSDLASVLSYGKRALQQGVVEGAQEAGSGVIQDVIAQQIYNPNQEIGGSALKEGAMGAGVGAVAQVGLDLILRKDIRRDYQASLAKKDKEELDKAMQAAKDTADADAASRPKEKMAAAQDKHPIYNPLGNFSAQKQTVADDGTTTQSLGLNADHLAFINKTRAEAGKPLLKSFSVEDLSDAGMPQQEISKLIAEKMGFTPSDTDVANAPQHIATVLNIAGQKNVDTDSQGFRDFLRRSTGTDDLNSMSPPQLFSAIKAVSALPISKTPLNLAGTSATRFSEEQYDVAINNLNSNHTEDNALSLAETIDKIKSYTGLKNDVDAESLLHTAAGRGDLYAKSYPNPDGTTNINVHVPNANKVAGGPDVRENTYASDSVPESYVIKTSQGDLEEHATEDKAWARIDTLSAARQGLAVRNTREAAKLGGQIAQSQTELDTMAAQGLTNTIEYQTKAAGLESKNQAKLAKIDSLNKAAENLAEPLTIEPRGEKITTKSDYTLYDNNEAAGTFDSREEAQAHAVSKLPDDTLRQIIAAAPNQKGDLAAELSVMAQDELKARYGSVEGILEPQMVGNTKAEERLLSAGLFTGRFKEQAAELEKKLRPMMTRLGLGDLHLNIVNAIRAGNEATADGEYSKRLIKIAIDAEKPMRVLRHEGIHALKELGAFSKDQWRVLENKAKSEWISKYKILERYQGLNLSPDALIEEAIADAFSDFDQTKPPAGLIGVVFNKIKSFMEALGNSLDGIGFHTSDSIFGKVEAGRLPVTREPTSMEVKNSASDYGRRDRTKEGERNTIHKYSAEINRIGDSLIKNKVWEDWGNYSSMNPRGAAAVNRVIDGIERRLMASGMSQQEAFETLYFLVDEARLNIAKIAEELEKELGFTPRSRNLTEAWEKAKKEGEFIYRSLGKDKEEGRFSLRASPASKKEITEFFEEAEKILDSGIKRLGWSNKISELEEEWTGGVGDFGNKEAANSIVFAKGFKDYRNDLEETLRNSFGDNVTVYRLMSPSQYRGLESGELQSADEPMAFSLSERTAASFRNFAGFDDGKENVRNYKLVEAVIPVEGIHMLGHHNESELVMRSSEIQPDSFRVIQPPTKETKFSLRETPKGEIHDELNKTPEGRRVVDLFTKHRTAEVKAYKDRSGRRYADGEATRAFRRFSKALKEYTGNDYDSSMRIASGLTTENRLHNEALDEALEDLQWSKDEGKFSLREGPPLPEKQARIYASELEKLVKRVGGRIAGMQSGETLEDVKALVKKLQQYTNQGIKGKEWYEDSAKAILNAFNGDKVLAEKFFQIISITSANTEVAANFTKASKAWEQFARGAEIKVGTERENRAVSDLLNFGIDWDGRKTNTFYSNFMDAMEGGDSGRSTIDLHMTQMLFDRKTPTDAQYDLAENLVGLVASKRNLPARQVQAASWITQKAKSIFERYRAKGYKKALSDAELRVYAMEMAIVDYSHLLGRRTTPLPVTAKLQKPSAETRAETHVITGEVIPAVSSEMGQVAELEHETKEGLNKIILDSGAIQGMAKALNLKSKIRISVGSGGYAGGITPNLIVHVHHDDPVIAKQDAMDLSQAMTYAFKQDATPFFRADPALADKAQLGYRFRFKRKELTLPQERKMFKALLEELGPSAGYTKTRTNELVLINYKGADAFVESAKEFADIAQRFQTKINKIAELEDTSVFGAESEYPYHDWKKQPAGGDLIKGLQAGGTGRSNILTRLDDIRESFKSSAREAVRSEGKEPRFSLRQTKTPEFKQWFGKSKAINADGTPKVWYHGTAQDIGTFIPKQARAIFLAESPGFAEDFTRLSENYMAMAAFGVMIPTKRYDLMMAAVNKAVKDGDIGLKEAREIRLTLLMYTDRADTTLGEAASLMRGAEGALDSLLLEKLPSRANIMPLYVRAENTFDYENPDHIKIIRPVIEKRRVWKDSAQREETQNKNDIANIEKGRWQSIEYEDIQKAIKDAGFDSFYVEEAGHKNLAVYSPNQVKSAVGNTGAFSRENDDVRYSLKVDKMKATGSSKAWILFSEASKGINFANIKTLEKAGEAAEEHYKEQIKNIPEFDGKAYMEGLTIGDINAYPPDIQHAIQEYKAGNKSKGIQEILDTVASQRKANIKEWKKYLENINPAMEKDPFWRDYVITSLLKSMRTDKPDTGLPLNANALGQLYQKFKQGENINFGKGYQSALVDATKDLVELGDATTGWRKIPQTDKNDPKFDERVAAVQSLSCTGWCTRSTMAAPYIQQGDFWVYVDDKKPQVAIRFEGDQVQEIQGPQNDRSIPTKYLKEITSLVDSGKIKNMTGQTKGDIAKAVRKSQFEAMIKEGLASGELVEKDDAFAKKNGITLEEKLSEKVYVDADGGITVDGDVYIGASAPMLTTVGGYASIDTGASAPMLTTVEGDVFMYEGASAPMLTTVGGYVSIREGASAPALTTVGGDAYINKAVSVPALTTVGGDTTINRGANVPNLTTVGGDAYIYDSAPKLTTVGGDVDLRDSAPKLTTVGGDAYIREGANVPKLTTVAGKAYINKGASAPALTTVGDGAHIRASVPALTTVGDDAYIRASAPALTTVGGEARIYEDASVPNLTTVGGDVFIDRGGSAPALTTVGGDAGIEYGSAPNIKRKGIGKEAALKGTALGKDDVKYSIRSNSAQTKPQGRWDEENTDLSPDMTAAINRTTTARKNEGWSDRIAAAFSPRSFTAFRQAFIHGADSISNLTRESALQFGEQEYHADRSAIAAVVFADRAAGIAASSFVNGPPVYKNGFASVPENSTVRGLIPILEPIMKGGAHMFQRFQFYAGTRRGSRLMYETRVGKDGKTITSTREQNFTKEDIERGKILEKMHPEFKQVFAEYQQYNNGLVQFMKDTGVISAKEAELWTKNWDYIPFYRQMDGDRINAPAIFSSISGVKKPKELKGGEAPLADFMETVIRNSRAAIEAGMKNVAGQRTIRDLLRLNQASEVPPATKGYDIVSIKQAGVTKFYKVDDSLVYEALKGLDAPHLPFVEILAKPANFLRDMVTKDPGFMLANLARDSMQAWVTSGVNMTPLFDTFKQAGKAMLGSNPEAAALARSGYFTGYDFAGDTKSSAAAVEKELRKRTGTQTGAEKALMPLSKIMDVLDKGAHISDLATRAEVYKRVLEETGSEAEATYQALEIMNFSRKGNSALIRIVTALVPFMNARIQGMDVLYRTGFGRSATVHNQKQKKLFATRSLTILGLTAMYLALASDTEEYKNATPEERDNYWILGGLGRIPIPFELGVLFKVFPERIYQHVWGMDTGADLRQSIARNLSSTLVINPIPHVVMPIVENIANYSVFTGQPIVGKGMEDVYTPYQANPSTSLLAQLVGKETNQSPLKIDNLIRGYTGTLGTYAVMLLDAAMRGEGDDVKATKKLEQMPVFKRFMTTKQGSGTINAYYELKKEVDTAVKTVNFLERQGDYDELAVFQAGRGGKLLGIKDYIKGLDEEMGSLRTFRREARRSRMDPDSLAEIESNIKDAEINVTKNIQFVKKALD